MCCYDMYMLVYMFILLLAHPICLCLVMIVYAVLDWDKEFSSDLLYFMILNDL